MSDPAPTSVDQTPPDPRWKLSPVKIAVAVILVIATVIPLLVPTYSRIEPRLFGFPFFYWYQLLWVFLCAAACGIAYLLIRDKHRAGTDRADLEREDGVR